MGTHWDNGGTFPWLDWAQALPGSPEESWEEIKTCPDTFGMDFLSSLFLLCVSGDVVWTGFTVFCVSTDWIWCLLPPYTTMIFGALSNLPVAEVFIFLTSQALTVSASSLLIWSIVSDQKWVRMRLFLGMSFPAGFSCRSSVSVLWPWSTPLFCLFLASSRPPYNRGHTEAYIQL